LHNKQTFTIFLFSGRCPDPVSGIIIGVIGYTVNVEEIKE
jgi:hypothetical protein